VRVGVVRDAFARWDAAPRLLSKSVAALGPGLAAVAAAVAEHHTRLIVDEYELGPDGQYHLKSVASDLLRWGPRCRPPPRSPHALPLLCSARRGLASQPIISWREIAVVLGPLRDDVQQLAGCRPIRICTTSRNPRVALFVALNLTHQPSNRSGKFNRMQLMTVGPSQVLEVPRPAPQRQSSRFAAVATVSPEGRCCSPLSTGDALPATGLRSLGIKS
jgi:hypothetical protein